MNALNRSPFPRQLAALQRWLLVYLGCVTRRKFTAPRWRFGNRGLGHADFLPEPVDLRGKLGQAPHSPERLRLPFRIENLLCHWLSPIMSKRHAAGLEIRRPDGACLKTGL